MYVMDGTAMTSSASISSEILAAPSSAVNDVPTCAARATPATSGVISLVFAHDDTSPVKAWAPIWDRPWNPSRPTWVPVTNDFDRILLDRASGRNRRPRGIEAEAEAITAPLRASGARN